MRTEFKPHEPPNSAEIEQMWCELNIQPIEINAPSVTKVVDLLRLIFIKGSVEFACFQIDRHPALEWFASRSRILPENSPHDIDFFGRFLTLPATRAALPMMRIGEHLSAELELEWISPFTLDGLIAEALSYMGGLQNRNLSGAECKQIGKDFCDALYGDRYDEVIVCTSYTQWCPWFKPPIDLWDCTWFCFDKSLYRCWLLAVTGED